MLLRHCKKTIGAGSSQLRQPMGALSKQAGREGEGDVQGSTRSCTSYAAVTLHLKTIADMPDRLVMDLLDWLLKQLWECQLL